jgi:hypothetical protein
MSGRRRSALRLITVKFLIIIVSSNASYRLLVAFVLRGLLGIVQKAHGKARQNLVRCRCMSSKAGLRGWNGPQGVEW